MKILHVIPSLRKGGAERICLDIVRETRKQGHAVDVAVLSRGNDYAVEYPDIIPMVINAKVIPSISGKWQTDLNSWDRLIADYKPDVIHSHLFEAEMVSRYHLLPGTRYFTQCHDNMHQLANFAVDTLMNKKKLSEFYEKQFIVRQYRKCNNQFIAISENTKSYFEKSLPSSLSDNVILLPNAIDFDRFHRSNHRRQASPVRLVNVGSFVPNKNQTFLVEVIKILATKGMDIKLVLLGDGIQLPVIKQKITAYGLEKIISTPGNVDNVADYLADANICVHSSFSEGFGLVLVEAMAAGLPVISLDGGGNRDVIVEGKTGYMISDGKLESFCSKIIALSAAQTKYDEISSNAVEFASQFDIKTYVSKLLDLYTK